MQARMNRRQSIPKSITPEELTDLLNSTMRSRGGKWKVVSVSDKSDKEMEIRYAKEVCLIPGFESHPPH